MKRPERRQIIYCCKPAEDYDADEAEVYMDHIEAERDTLQSEIQALIAPTEAGGGVEAHLRAERDTLQAQLTEANRLLRENLRRSDEAVPGVYCDCFLCNDTRAHLNPPKENTDG